MSRPQILPNRQINKSMNLIGFALKHHGFYFSNANLFFFLSVIFIFTNRYRKVEPLSTVDIHYSVIFRCSLCGKWEAFFSPPKIRQRWWLFDDNPFRFDRNPIEIYDCVENLWYIKWAISMLISTTTLTVVSQANLAILYLKSYNIE